MKFFTSVYVLLLAYVVVALVFWESSLQRQSNKIYEQDKKILNFTLDSVKSESSYRAELGKINHAYEMRTKQYIGEGSTFLIVILIGAFVVYKSIQRGMKLSRQQNNFMLSVTHELKSPIAGIKLNLQTLAKHKLDEEKRNLLIDRSIKEANRLNDLCNNMLYASRIEGQQSNVAKENISLSELAIACYNDFSIRYPARFISQINEGCMVNGDKMMLQIAINNLLENAIKYTPQDTKIELRLAPLGNKAVLTVVDSGPGIPDSEKRKIFTKFYRIGNEESRKAKGTGLGLYLTKKIVEQHSGSIAVKDNSPNGAIFEIKLPNA